MAKAKTKAGKTGAGKKKGGPKTPEAVAQQMEREERIPLAVAMRKQQYTLEEIGKRFGVTAKTICLDLQAHRDEVRERGILGTADMMIDSDESIRRGINQLERLQIKTKGYLCRDCKKPVACKCGVSVEVPVLKPEGVIRNRAEVLKHDESLRRLHGVDAAKSHIILEGIASGVDGAVVGLMQFLREKDPAIADRVKELIDEAREQAADGSD